MRYAGLEAGISPKVKKLKGCFTLKILVSEGVEPASCSCRADGKRPELCKEWDLDEVHVKSHHFGCHLNEGMLEMIGGRS